MGTWTNSSSYPEQMYKPKLLDSSPSLGVDTKKNKEKEKHIHICMNNYMIQRPIRYE